MTAPLSDLQLAARVELVKELGVEGAAKYIGVNESNIRRALVRAAYRGITGGPSIPEQGLPPQGMRIVRNSAKYDKDGMVVTQWVGSKTDTGASGDGDEYKVPAGHVVKGESALLGPDGRVLNKWVKTSRQVEEHNLLVEGLKEAFASYAGQAALPQAPIDGQRSDLITLYPVPDLHLGLLTWPKETGDDYTIKIAVDMATKAVGQLVAQSYDSQKATLLFMGDYFHSNDAKAVTPGSGHQLDVDGRWPKIFAAGAKLAVALVDLVAAKHQEVDVILLKGNHDPDASMSLMVALGLFYQNNPRITVSQDPGIAWYQRFGKVLLGATHGHTMKPKDMAMMLAADRPEDWGLAKHRHFFFGHIHHESALEVGPVRVESFSAPTGKDSFTGAHGYRSGRALNALTFHAEDGEIGRHRVNITEKK